VRSTFVRILRYAAQTGRPHNVRSDDLKSALGPIAKQNFAAIVAEWRNLISLVRSLSG